MSDYAWFAVWLEFLEKACDEFDWSASHQQREWVGLTDEEIYEMADEGVFLGNVKEIARAIEAKLKEKNT
jgi:hypothetical protein